MMFSKDITKGRKEFKFGSSGDKGSLKFENSHNLECCGFPDNQRSSPPSWTLPVFSSIHMVSLTPNALFLSAKNEPRI